VPGPTAVPTEELRSRERLLTSALIALALFLGGATYVLWRAVQREVAVGARLTELVLAGSHRLRPPPPSMRPLLDLLQESGDAPPERRAAFYDVLARNTERLQRQVESLLDFGRMENARRPYDLRPVDVHALVSTVVDEFRADPVCGGRPVVFSAKA